jgi:hypothetical protein
MSWRIDCSPVLIRIGLRPLRSLRNVANALLTTILCPETWQISALDRSRLKMKN